MIISINRQIIEIYHQLKVLFCAFFQFYLNTFQAQWCGTNVKGKLPEVKEKVTKNLKKNVSFSYK